MERPIIRCWWCGDDPLYQHYHDHEWGRPVTDDIRLFEKICLEGFQAGLSWITILRKRPAFRVAFDDFDFEKISRYNEKRILFLLQDTGIVRHRGKIESVLNNARCAVRTCKEFGTLSNYFWQWQPPESDRPTRFDQTTLKGVSHTKTSTALSKDLKKWGWTFVGPTTIYAFMQATGIVNDHVDACSFRKAVDHLPRPVGKIASV